MKPGAYKKQFGIPSKQPLSAKSYSEARRAMAVDRGLTDNLAKARQVRMGNIEAKKAALAKPAKAKALAPAKAVKAPKAAKPAKVAKTQAELTAALKEACESHKRKVTTFVEVVLNQELGEPFRRDAMKKPVIVAGIKREDMRPQVLA